MIENQLHQISKGPITDMSNCFNALDKNYPEAEAIRRGINAATSKNYKEIYLQEKAKETGVKNNFNRPDFSDLLEH